MSRTFARILSILVLVLGSAGLSSLTTAQSQAQAQSAPLKIGIIGTGRIGGALARHWVAAGHDVFMSSRHPEELADLAAELGPRAQAGMPREAAAFGDVILVSVPYAAMPQIGQDFAAELAGKIVLDTSNPSARRDGEMAGPALAKGSGLASAEFLGDVRLVRAFNCIPAAAVASEGNRQPTRIAIPLAGDDAEALAMAQRLVDDAGFDNVIIGNLDSARHFDLGQPLALGTPSADELRAAARELGLEPQN
jgi:predicted dinucleotide-binding enzyme